MGKQFSEKDNRPWKTTFFLIWGSQALSILGSQLVQFALIWYLTIKWVSATVLATASLFGMLPGVILGPLVGTLVDRCNRRSIMIIADSVIALATIVLIIAFVNNSVSTLHIYMIIFIRSLAGSFHSNAMIASTSLMVPKEQLTRIQGINEMLNGGLNIVAAPLGALLLEILPIQGILSIDVLTALAAITPLCFLSIPQPTIGINENSIKAKRSTIWTDFRAGLQYLLTNKGLFLIALMTVGINFMLMPAFSLLPLMVKDYFGGGAIQLSWLESSIGIGIILGGAILSFWGGFKRKILTSMLGLIGLGSGTLIMALAPSSLVYVSIVGAFIFGMMNPITMGPFYAILQATVEPGMQARIFSLLSSVGTGVAPVGLLLAGPISEQFGIQSWFFLGSSVCILMGVVGLSIPAIMNIDGRINEESVEKTYLPSA